MDIIEICETYCRMEDQYAKYHFGGVYWGKDYDPSTSFMYDICKEVREWEGTPVGEYLEPKIRDYLEKKIKDWEYRLNTPAKERKYFYEPFFGDKPISRRNAIITGFENWHENYIYVLKEEEAYGKRQFVVAHNNTNDCVILPPRKAFQNLEVGHFYMVKLVDHINHNRWQEYKYEIVEVDESTYLKEGMFWDR